MKLAQLGILALLIVAGAIPLTNAQSNQTGQTAIYCPSNNSGNCSAEQMVGSTPPYIAAGTGVPGRPAIPMVDLFTAFSATGGPTQKNIMITIKISAPFSGCYGQFIVEAQLGSNAVVRPYRPAPSSEVYFETNQLVPNMVTFTFMSVSRVSVSLARLCWGVGRACSTTEALVPPGQFFTIEWQIQDPPGPASASLPFDLLTIIALIIVPLVAVESVYLVSLRRRLSKKA
jgi:hypothetical protein